VWVADSDRNVIYRIDPRTNAVTQIPGNGAPTGLAFGVGSLWVLNTVDNTVAQLDPASGTTRHTVALPPGFSKGGFAADGEQVWIAHATADGNLTFVDPRSLAVRTANIALPSQPAPSFTDVAIGQGAVWASGLDPLDTATAGVSKVDPRTGKLLSRVKVEGCGGCAGTPAVLAVGAEGVWVVHSGIAVAEVDVTGGSVVRSIRAGSSVDAVAVGAGSVWVASALDGTVSRIDPATGMIVATIPVGPNPFELVVDENGVWVAVRP
jgi:YVTN family beta-propeller protein